MISQTIIRHLIHNIDYGRKALPFLKAEYFDGGEATIFSVIQEYSKKYGEIPSLEAISIDLSNKSLSQDGFESAKDILIQTAEPPEANTSMEWLVDATEKYCQEKAISNALYTCVMVQNGEEKNLHKGDFPRILSEALAVSFDLNLGHNFFKDAEKQFEFYHDKQKRLPFDIEKLDEITGGGLLPKTLNLFMASTGVGKSLIMCSTAAGHLRKGKNVLYLTMEMSEPMIRQRIDANLLNINIGEFEGKITREKYFGGIDKLRKLTQGTLVIKEYPSGTANIDHFDHFIQELRIKEKFVPDVVYVDYLNICNSVRHKADSGSYGFIKGIAQEIRSLAQKHDIPFVSATQTNRGGYNNTDIDMGDISESFGTGHEVDLLIGVMQSEELESTNQFKFKQLKSRYGDINKMNCFVIGVDKPKMRLYDVEHTAQAQLAGDTTFKPANRLVENKQVFEGWQ